MAALGSPSTWQGPLLSEVTLQRLSGDPTPDRLTMEHGGEPHLSYHVGTVALSPPPTCFILNLNTEKWNQPLRASNAPQPAPARHLPPAKMCPHPDSTSFVLGHPFCEPQSVLS